MVSESIPMNYLKNVQKMGKKWNGGRANIIIISKSLSQVKTERPHRGTKLMRLNQEGSDTQDYELGDRRKEGNQDKILTLFVSGEHEHV